MTEAGKSLWVRSGYGYNTKEPFVALTMPGGESVQMGPAEARKLAVDLIEAAEAANSDAFMFEWVMGTLKGTEQMAAGVLNEFRQWREKRT